MIKLPPSLFSRFVAILLAFQLPTGVWVCHAGEGSLSPHALAPIVLGVDTPSHHSERGAGAHHHQEHDHTDSGNHDCPETFLTPPALGPLQYTAQERAPTLRFSNSPSPAYDVPQPIPIA